MKSVMGRALAVGTIAGLMAGCDYSLSVPFPTLSRRDDPSTRLEIRDLAWHVDPATPSFGDIATLSISGLPGGYPCQVFLETTDTPGGSNYLLGSLDTTQSTASLAFELRSVLGNDQNGQPFRLTSGQHVGVFIKILSDRTGNNTGAYFGASLEAFTIR